MSSARAERAAALAAGPLRPAAPPSAFITGTWTSFKDIWAHRELLGLLVRRELKARYKDSSLGFVWTLIRPLMMLVIYYVAIGKFLGAEQLPGRPGGIPNFAIYIFTGLTAWQLFSEVVLSGTGSIVANGGLIKKVYLPREVFPLSTTGSALFNFAIQLGILTVASLVFGSLRFDARLAYLLLSFALLLVWSLALAIVLSAVNVYLRDMQYLVEVAVMVLFWMSPIVYSWEQVFDVLGGVPWAKELYLANPTTLAVLGFQRTFWAAGETVHTADHLAARLAIETLICLVLLWLAQRIFSRLQSNFAQEL